MPKEGSIVAELHSESVVVVAAVRCERSTSSFWNVVETSSDAKLLRRPRIDPSKLLLLLVVVSIMVALFEFSGETSERLETSLDWKQWSSDPRKVPMTGGAVRVLAGTSFSCEITMEDCVQIAVKINNFWLFHGNDDVLPRKLILRPFARTKKNISNQNKLIDFDRKITPQRS